MPGVKKLAQESETQSKPKYIHGHMWGGVGILVGKAKGFSCVPLSLKIHDGLQAVSNWNGTAPVSHVIQMIRDGVCAAQGLKRQALFLLDRYFLSVPALLELKQQNAANQYKVDIITKLKKSTIAYEPAPVRLPGQRGRSRKKGAKVKLSELFETLSAQFKSQSLDLYDRKYNLRYLCVDLLWGQGLYQKLRFVLVEYDGAQSILASTDLTLSPLSIIQLYSYRFRIEHTFRELKQEIGGFAYHFWTKALPKLSAWVSQLRSNGLNSTRTRPEPKRRFISSKTSRRFY